MKYCYKLNWDYTIKTLRNFEPVKNYYIFQPNYAPERPLIVPLEARQPFEKYHTYHLEGTVTNRVIHNKVEFHTERETTDFEKQIRKVVQASIAKISINNLTDMLADLPSKNEHFIKEYTHYKNRTNHPDQTEIR